MARFRIPLGLTLFCLVWLVILLAPPLRELYSLSFPTLGNQFEAKAIDFKGLSSRYPNDLDVQALTRPAMVSNRSLKLTVWPGMAMADDDQKMTLARADSLSPLIASHPRENWLRAQRINTLLSRPVQFVRDGKSNPNAQPSEYLYRQALQCARAAQRIEPQNAFFVWVEAIYWFRLKNEGEVRKALQRVANCKDFDDFSSTVIKKRLRVFSLDHKLSFQEKANILYSEPPYYHLALSNMSQYGVEQVLPSPTPQAHKKALGYANDYLNAMATLESDKVGVDTQAFSYFSRLALIINLSKKLNIAPRFQSVTSDAEREEYQEACINALRAHALQHGYADLAESVTGVAQTNTSAFRQPGLNPWYVFGPESPSGEFLIKTQWLANRLASFSIGFGVLWFLTLPWSHFFRKEHEPMESVTLPKRGHIVFCTNFTLWALFGFFWISLLYGAAVTTGGIHAGIFISFIMPADMEANSNIDTYLPIACGLAWFLPCFLTARLMRNRTKHSGTSSFRSTGFWLFFSRLGKSTAATLALSLSLGSLLAGTAFCFVVGEVSKDVSMRIEMGPVRWEAVRQAKLK